MRESVIERLVEFPIPLQPDTDKNQFLFSFMRAVNLQTYCELQKCYIKKVLNLPHTHLSMHDYEAYVRSGLEKRFREKWESHFFNNYEMIHDYY